MARSYTDLERECNYWRDRCLRAEAYLETEQRRSAALRGHLGRMKRLQHGD